jgi:cytochrome b
MSEQQAGAGTGYRTLVWDAATRITHWLLVLTLAFSWWSAENHHMDWHRLSGYLMLALIVFRLFWGFAGSTASRFASFVRGPGAVLAYARTVTRRDMPVVPGHNPMGGWSVVAMLALLAIQVALGLFAVDIDGLESGPLSWLVSFEAGRQAAELHELVFNLLMILVVLHIAAILYYLIVRRENLVAAMIGGTKRLARPVEGFRAAGPIAYLVGIVLAGGIAWAISTGLPFLE